MNNTRCLFGLFMLVSQMIAGQSHKISGRVYHDENRNGIYDKGEQPLREVLISNGKDIVTTDTNGNYKIKPLKNNPVFVIKPKGYISLGTPQNNLKFYYLFQETNVNKQFDFPLIENEENDTVNIALLGDPQADVIDDIHHVNKLVTEELAKSHPDIIVPLGDLSFDNLSIFKPLSETLGLVEVPVFYVIGNHDLNFGEKEFSDRDKTFEASFGPSYYAFEYGNNLFLVLNNNYPVNDREYVGKFDEDQLAFVAGIVDKLSPLYKGVKIFTHIPLEYTQNKDALIELIAPFEKVLVVTGHTHTQYHRYFERKDQTAIHQLVGGAVCGAWWQGAHDIEGIPYAMMNDGTPKGYWRLKTNDDTYKLRYKVSGSPEEKQINVWVPEHKEWDKEMNTLNEPYIYANVFAADSNTNVQLSFDGKTWHHMEHYSGVSPELKRFYKLQELGRYNGQKLTKVPEPLDPSKHLWRFKIPDQLKAGTYLIKVRADNPFLDLHEEEVRVFRKEK